MFSLYPTARSSRPHNMWWCWWWWWWTLPPSATEKQYSICTSERRSFCVVVSCSCCTTKTRPHPPSHTMPSHVTSEWSSVCWSVRWPQMTEWQYSQLAMVCGWDGINVKSKLRSWRVSMDRTLRNKAHETYVLIPFNFSSSCSATGQAGHGIQEARESHRVGWSNQVECVK